MFEGKLERSPNWDKYKDVESFVQEGFPFLEGFPRRFYRSVNWPYVDPFLFTLITIDGERYTAMVDTTTQYRAEGLRWTTYPERRAVSKHAVVAWNELDQSEYPNYQVPK